MNNYNTNKQINKQTTDTKDFFLNKYIHGKILIRHKIVGTSKTEIYKVNKKNLMNVS